MKIIKVGKVNDLIQYAMWYEDEHNAGVPGRYIPLSQIDLEFQPADAKIYYDSGIYPSITQEALPQYICDKATSR
jgi:hypothetical protein